MKGPEWGRWYNTPLANRNTLILSYIVLLASVLLWTYIIRHEMHKVFQKKDVYAELINKSGKQRMLSQRTAYLADLYYESGDTAMLEQLIQARNTMSRDKDYIIAHLPSEHMHRYFLEGESPVVELTNNYLQTLDLFINDPGRARVKELQLESFALLPVLDEAVNEVEDDLQTTIKGFKDAERNFFIWAILTIVVVALLVVLPVILRHYRLNKGFETAKEHAEANEVKLNEAQRLAMIGNWIMDFKKEELIWSDEIYRIFGLDMQRFTPSYERFLGAIHPDDKERVDEAYQKHLRTQEPYDIVHRLLLEDGTEKYVQERCESTFDAEGNPIRSMGTVADITERVAVETRLRKANEINDLLARISQSFLKVDDFPRTMNHAMNELGNFTGVSRIRVMDHNYAKNTTSITWEWCADGVSPKIGHLQDMPYSTDNTLKDVLIRNGKISIVDVQGMVARNAIASFELEEVGSLLAFPVYLDDYYNGLILIEQCGVIRDWLPEMIEFFQMASSILSSALARNHYISEIDKSKLRLELALSNSQSVSWYSNLKTGETEYSDSFYELLGYDKAVYDHSFDHWLEVIHPEDRVVFRQATLRHEQGLLPYYEANLRIRRKNGDYIWIKDKGKIVRYDNEHKPLIVIGVFVDISIQKYIEQELVSAKEESQRNEIKLREANATKDKVFSIISHDLRSPFNAILGITEILDEDFDDFDNRMLKELFGHISTSSKRLFNLLENLLQWSRMQLENITPEQEVMDVSELLTEVVDLFAPNAAAKDVDLRLQEKQRTMLIMADRHMLSSILRNLVSNAIKFTPAQGQVLLAASQTETNVEITITDTGVGMPAEKLKRIFEIYESKSTHGTDEEPGSGLGLSLIHDLVELINGTISVESEPGKGTRFTVGVPVRL